MITLREITPENYRAIFALKVAPGQENFVANNIYSMAQAKVYGQAVPRAIYAEETPVGFVMYSPEGAGEFYIWRYMIGAEHQQKGYGRAALKVVIEHLRAQAASAIALSYEPNNTVAARLYASFGFVETGEVDDGELVARLALNGKD